MSAAEAITAGGLAQLGTVMVRAALYGIAAIAAFLMVGLACHLILKFLARIGRRKIDAVTAPGRPAGPERGEVGDDTIAMIRGAQRYDSVGEAIEQMERQWAKKQEGRNG